MKTSKLFKRLLTYLKPHKRYVIITLVAALFQVLAALIGPLFIGQMVDHIVGPGHVDFAAVGWLLVIFILMALITSIAQLMVNYNTNKLAFYTLTDLRNQLMEKLNKLPIFVIDTKPHGEFINIMIADIELIANGLLQGGTQFFSGVLTIIGTISLMFYTQFNITIVVLLLTPLSIIVAQFIARRVFNRFREQSQIRGELAGFLEEMLSNTALIKNLAYEDVAQTRFDDINTRLYDKGWRAQFASASINPSTRIVNNIIYVSVGIYGAMLVQQGALTVGALSAFLIYANQYMQPFNEISNVMAELQAALASCSRVFGILDLKDEKPDAAHATELIVQKGSVAMEHLKFSYHPKKPFIEDLSFTAKPGKTIAIVGPTGSGKTTIINLLMRFYELNGGNILIDGHDSLSLTKESLRAAFGMVLQDSWLFTGTVRDNIAFGKPYAEFRDIIDVAQKAQIHHAIEQLPQSYDTVLSSKHDTLSQGQKQLLCIARVMLLDPPMLILDEATSNIDTRTEIAIGETLKELMKNRTSFIIAHRLSTIQNADLILVMNEGSIVEQGTHTQLLKKKGSFYAKLYNSQFANQTGEN